MMERVNRILWNPTYRTCLSKIADFERSRIFCGHDMAHFLDVARLAYLFNLEEQLGVEKELIYAAALLHDVGRFVQYEDGTPHQLASVPLAKKILSQCGFKIDEQFTILRAIENHRNPDIRQEKSLSGLIYRADKMSRSCFGCEAEAECDWSREKKNLDIQY